MDDTADAETCVVCGSLGTLRNGLNNQDGANFDVKEVREEPLVSRRRSTFVDEVAVDVERFESTEACDGEILRVVTVVFGVLVRMLTGRDSSTCPSGGNSAIIRRGLSSMGAILVDMIELR